MKKIMAPASWLLLFFLVLGQLMISWTPLARLDYQAVTMALSQMSTQIQPQKSQDGSVMPPVIAENLMLPPWQNLVQKYDDWVGFHPLQVPAWKYTGQGVVLSSWLTMLAGGPETIINYSPRGWIELDQLRIRTSPWGTIYVPVNSNPAEVADYVSRGHYLAEPWWGRLLLAAIAVGYWVLMMMLVRQLKSGWIWASPFLFLLVVGILDTWLVSALSWWVPFIAQGFLVLIFTPYFLHYCGREKILAGERDLLDKVRTELFQYQLDNEKIDQMFRQISMFGVTGEHKSQLYELGLAFERKRSYEKARKIFEVINNLGGYEDSADRVQHASKAAAPSVDLPDMQSTLVLDNNALQLPQLGRYQIIKELGRGSMGVVYLASDPRIERQVALKTIHMADMDAEQIDSVKQRFFREAQAAGRLNHPNIVTVYDVGEEKNLAYIAMDYVIGQPMSSYTERSKLLPIKQLLTIFIDVARALQFAHQNDIVHRDIKPSNLLYDSSRGQVKVSDFGIARIADSKQTQTGIVLGSPSYMSPEQIRGEKLDGKSDIFSLGVSLYQLLTGELPFSGDNLPGLAYAITHNKQKSPKDYREEIPQSVTRIINKALQKDPVNRFADANIMADTLSKAADRLET